MLRVDLSRPAAAALLSTLAFACSGPPAHPAPPPPRDAAVDAAPSPAAAALDRMLGANDVAGAVAWLGGLPPTGLVADDIQGILARRWPALVAALAARGTPTSAYFTLARVLPAAGLGAPLRGLLATLAERAADGEIGLARVARGPGGAWLHATLAARIAGGKPPRVAAATLDVATRIDLDFTPVPSSCSWVDGPARREGRRVGVTTSGLSCTLARSGGSDAARITGTVTLRWEPAGEQHVPIDLATPIGAEAVRALHASLAATVSRQWADTAHALALAALAAKDLATAEDQLVLHARYVAPAPPSPELVEVMQRYGVSYPEL